LTLLRTLPGLAALVALAACAVAAGAQAQTRSLETAIKAAFLTKFGAFVTWPGGASAAPLNLCIVGDDPFGQALEQAAKSQQGYAIAIHRMSAVERGSGCNVLYAAGSSRQSAAEALAAVDGAPVLTVTDAARGGARGMIHFVVFGDRVRFQVDAGKASKDGIAISSKLLSLALSVKR
jgi:hypothetical protein